MASKTDVITLPWPQNAASSLVFHTVATALYQLGKLTRLTPDRTKGRRASVFPPAATAAVTGPYP